MTRRKQFELETLKRNIKDIYQQATGYEVAKGKAWYRQANAVATGLSTEYNVPLFKVAGILAALSPQKDWYTNQLLTAEYLATGTCRHFAQQVQKCDWIMEYCDTVEDVAAAVFGTSGHKTQAFYLNIMGNESQVTIDRHAIAVALGGETCNITPKRYALFSKAYREVAKEYNLKPYQLQAVTWVCWRRLKGLTEDEFLQG